jgi:hypothetical protein
MTVPAPMLRNSLELLGHAVEHYVGGSAKDRRIAVQLLWQSCELAAKDVLVRENVPIVDNNGKFFSGRTCVAKVGEVWGMGTTPRLAEMDLLRDERNAIQHRYGTIDEYTMDYYMEIAFAFVSDVLSHQGLDLHDYLRRELQQEIWRACRFIQDEQEQKIARARSLTPTNPAAGLIEAFAALEAASLGKALAHGTRPVSTLDLLMKFGTSVADQGGLDKRALRGLGDVYRLRNDAVQRNAPLSADEVIEAIDVIEPFLDAISDDRFTDAFSEALARTRERPPTWDDQRQTEPTSEQMLATIANRQLRYGPPERFVGLGFLAKEFDAHEVINAMIESGLLLVYQVPNPHSEHATSAVRVNLDKPEATSLLEEDVARQLRELSYPD